MIDFDQFGENIRNKPKVGQSLGLFPYDFPKINEQFLKENFKKTNARQLIKSVENAFVLSNMGSEKELKPKGIFNRLKKILFHA
jgi:predicted Ser/Thr protein kinase